MLVLSRKENESIELPELGIVIRVMGLKKTRVKIGIDAPPAVTVMRSEMLAESPAKIASYLRPLECPSRQLDKELTRLESQVAAMAELADSRDRSLAREVAADAIDRLAKVKRRIDELSRTSRQPVAQSDVVAVRADVIDQLRGSEEVDASSDHEFLPATVDSRYCVKQSEAEYSVEKPIAKRRPKNRAAGGGPLPVRQRTCVVA